MGYRGKGQYYPGRISKDHGNGTYDIDYDDGEKEFKVAATLIRALPDGRGGAFVRFCVRACACVRARTCECGVAGYLYMGSVSNSARIGRTDET